MKLFTTIGLFIVLVPALLLATEPKTIRLVCAYSHTVNNDGKISPTNGKDLVTVRYSDNGDATIRKSDLGAEFSGSIDEEEIHGTATYGVGDSKVAQVLTINRYTGQFTLTFEIDNKGGIVHYGACEVATSRLF